MTNRKSFLKKYFAGACVLSVAVLTATPAAQAAVCDLTTMDVCTVNTIYGPAIFQTDNTHPAGSGFIDNKDDIFLTLRASGSEQGYNTDAKKAPFDVQRDGNRFNNPLRLQDLNTVTYNGQQYYSFLIDINEPGGGKEMISLDMLKVYTSSSSTLGSTSTDAQGSFTGFTAQEATKRFDLDLPDDSFVKYNDQNSGSGEGDIAFFIPTTAFTQNGFLGLTAANPTDYVYLYAQFGKNISADLTSQGGFEEFWTAKNLTPIPEVPAFLPLGGVLLIIMGANYIRQRRAKTSA